MKKKYFISFAFFIIAKLAFAQVGTQYLGEIKLFTGNFAPAGWALCNGQLLPINQNQALFSILGTTYGGDGRVNFALPDLRGRVIIGAGSSYVLGQRGGALTATVTQSNMAAHQHGVPMTISSASGTLNAPTATSKIANPVLMVNGIPRAGLGYNTTTANVPLKGTTTTSAGTASVVPVGIEQPSLGLVYIIALQGIFPSQN